MDIHDGDRRLMDGDRDGEEGQTLVEYSMVISIVSVALIGMLMLLKVSVEGFYQQIIDAIAAVA